MPCMLGVECETAKYICIFQELAVILYFLFPGEVVEEKEKVSFLLLLLKFISM